MSGNTATPPYVYTARVLALQEGGIAEGIVLRLPGRAIHSGSRLFLQTDSGEAICLPATARAGWIVLERALVREGIAPGDRITIRFREWRQTSEGGRRYRDVDVMVLDRQAESAA